MNYKFLLVIVAILCLVIPSMALGTVRWTNQNGDTITSAYVGDTVRLAFDTVNNGSDVQALNGTWYNSTVSQEMFFLQLLQQNQFSGGWTLVDDCAKQFPDFNAQYVDVWNVTQTVSVPYWDYCTVPTPSILLLGRVYGGYAYKGWTNFTITDDNVVVYHGRMIEMAPYMNISWYNVTTNATLTVSKNPLLLTNLNDFVDDIGGAGLRYLLGVIIIGILAFIPFFLMRELNVYIEVIMIILGVGISYLIGLFDLWVVFALAIGSLAVFLMLRDRMGGG